MDRQHRRAHWPKDRWHSAIRIQAVMRMALCKRRFTAPSTGPRDALRRFIHDAIAASLLGEAALMIQTQFRMHLACRRVQRLRQQRDEALKELGLFRARMPDLFSAYDIPAELLDFQALLRLGAPLPPPLATGSSASAAAAPPAAASLPPQVYALDAYDQRARDALGITPPPHWQPTPREPPLLLEGAAPCAALTAASGPSTLSLFDPPPPPKHPIYDELQRSPLLTARIDQIFDFIDRHRTGLVDQRYCLELVERMGGGTGGPAVAQGGHAETLQAVRRAMGGTGGHKMPAPHLHLQLNRAEFFQFMIWLLKR